MTGALAQGLVGFDAAGQIEPALAERWTVIDGGTSYIFRLKDARWADGSAVTADQVAAILMRAVRARANPLAPFLSAIEEIVAMTPQVIEIRLARPRTDLLKLFAQPEMGIARRAGVDGTGPFLIGADDSAILHPSPDPERDDRDDAQPSTSEDNVRLTGERAALAITRFVNRRSDLVADGSFVDWPLLATTDVPANNVRTDPAVGLFGLAIVNRTGFLADALNRAAIAQAIDRTALTTAIAPGWDAAQNLLPDGLDSAAPSQVPAWSILSRAQRIIGARARVESWKEPVVLRIAMPTGPGATIAYGHIATDLIQIGIIPERVGMSAATDLVLVDRVAPYDSARWYLATACMVCGETAQQAVREARDAPTLRLRAQRLAEADAAVNDDAAFIVLARPLRWSLVSERLRQWQPNTRAWHPLNHLRPDPS